MAQRSLRGWNQPTGQSHPKTEALITTSPSNRTQFAVMALAIIPDLNLFAASGARVVLSTNRLFYLCVTGRQTRGTPRQKR